MPCPSCYADLTDATPTPSGLLCHGCGHLWTVDGGEPAAINQGGPLLAERMKDLIVRQVTE